MFVRTNLSQLVVKYKTESQSVLFKVDLIFKQHANKYNQPALLFCIYIFLCFFCAVLL